MPDSVTPVTPVLILAIAGNMTAAVALVTIGVAIEATAATTAERNATDGSGFSAIPGEMSGTVTTITHTTATHD